MRKQETGDGPERLVSERNAWRALAVVQGAALAAHSLVGCAPKSTIDEIDAAKRVLRELGVNPATGGVL